MDQHNIINVMLIVATISALCQYSTALKESDEGVCITSTTRIQTSTQTYRVSTKVRFESCFLWWCNTLYRTEYRQAIRTITRTIAMDNFVCCRDYELIDETCIRRVTTTPRPSISSTNHIITNRDMISTDTADKFTNNTITEAVPLPFDDNKNGLNGNPSSYLGTKVMMMGLLVLLVVAVVIGSLIIITVVRRKRRQRKPSSRRSSGQNEDDLENERTTEECYASVSDHVDVNGMSTSYEDMAQTYSVEKSKRPNRWPVFYSKVAKKKYYVKGPSPKMSTKKEVVKMVFVENEKEVVPEGDTLYSKTGNEDNEYNIVSAKPTAQTLGYTDMGGASSETAVTSDAVYSEMEPTEYSYDKLDRGLSQNASTITDDALEGIKDPYDTMVAKERKQSEGRYDGLNMSSSEVTPFIGQPEDEYDKLENGLDTKLEDGNPNEIDNFSGTYDQLQRDCSIRPAEQVSQVSNDPTKNGNSSSYYNNVLIGESNYSNPTQLTNLPVNEGNSEGNPEIYENFTG